MPPKVSVVIKSYNHAAYIGQTIRSILEQSFQDFEIIVTDDGSTDGTPDIVRQFSDSRIKLEVLPRNHGISLAMNLSIARATGEYIAILNSDDFALPGRLEKQVNFLDSRPDVSVVVGLPMPVDDDGKPCEPYNDFDRPLSFPDFKTATWLNSFFFKGNCICAPTAMIRRSVYMDIGEYNPKLTNIQDFDIWIRFLSAGHTIFLLPEKLTAFRIRKGFQNMSAPRTDSILRGNFELTQVIKEYGKLDLKLLHEVFAKEIRQANITKITNPGLLVASLALTVNSPSYALIALQLTFEHAGNLDEFNQLKKLAGELDIFNIQALTACAKRIDETGTENNQLLNKTLASDEAEVTRIYLENYALKNSTSWKITAPLRRIARFIRKAN